jgi:metal-responsive CopG/Arc/MetJ family transcriptional regulator
MTERFSASVSDDLYQKLEDLSDGEDATFESRSNAVTRLCERGLEWRAAFGHTDADPADVLEELTELGDRVDELEDALADAEDERREALRVARGVIDQDRGLLERIADAIHGRDPYQDVPAIGEASPESVEAVPLDQPDADP